MKLQLTQQVRDCIRAMGDGDLAAVYALHDALLDMGVRPTHWMVQSIHPDNCRPDEPHPNFMRHLWGFMKDIDYYDTEKGFIDKKEKLTA